MNFNPNELVIERVRSVEEYDIATNELTGRYTQIEDPTLEISANGTDVLDAMENVIYTIYRGQTGTFSFSNSLFSLDLAASQFGTRKALSSDQENGVLIVPVSETIQIASDNTITLQYVPVGTAGAEVAYVRVINDDMTFGEKYTVGATADAEAKTFVIDAASKKITLPEGTTGNVFVNYERESSEAAVVTKTTDGIPEVKKLIINVIFHDKCNTNKVIAGCVVCYRAQIDPSSVSINFTPDGKHAASYKLQKQYCDPDGKLIDIIVSAD